MLKRRRKTSDCGARETGLNLALPSTSRGTLGRSFFSLMTKVVSFREKGFPCGLASKESACNVGDLSLIPG